MLRRAYGIPESCIMYKAEAFARVFQSILKRESDGWRAEAALEKDADWLKGRRVSLSHSFATLKREVPFSSEVITFNF